MPAHRTVRAILAPADRATAEHGVMLITLSNPGKLNATDAGMHAELSTIFADIHASPEVRGRGRHR